ncbi:hypothetical protein CTAYLR_010575 [Chrysophaeum taylorii]|uniref:DUF659 domain-containing protein n=1 Tax=Chrysophaeum taylorii TaxID=2483200 RepID=A0AAD7UKT1_9STRA|nr:hypothetical protein CTAYLR_010575 [Chrysophaeum taylorii]
MIKPLNAPYVNHLPKSEAFRRTWTPRLFEETVQNINKMWFATGNFARTLGFDGFKTETGTHVIIVTECSGEKTAFKACVDPGEHREDAPFYNNLIISQLVSGAGEKPVEEVYAGVVADNVRYNRSAFALVVVAFPELFFIGCVAHCVDLMMEDLAIIPEIKVIIDTCVRISNASNAATA